MKVLTVGGGAREHAMVMALVQSGAEHYSIMSNNNPGIARLSRDVRNVKETDVQAVCAQAIDWGIELALIGPEAPLGEGIVDELERNGIPCASPSKDAARIEISKSFMRDLMKKHSLPGSIRFATFMTMDGVERFLDELDDAVAVKPVGLTGGKGVKMAGEHLMDRNAILEYCREILDNSIGGKGGFVLEERLVGEEFTLQCFCDGKNAYPMPAVQDHKRAYEGDTGPNTGGMGSYSQADHLLPFLTRNEYDQATDIVRATIKAMESEGCPYKGVIYGQFMLTRAGPKVIEFNARFGDPEAMNVLTLFSGNFVKLAKGMASGNIPKEEVQFKRKATVCKYVVPEGYGVRSVSNQPLHVDEEHINATGAKLYYAAVDKREDGLFTTTSRSLGIVGVADTISGAESMAEEALKGVSGRIFMRRDIGKSDSIQRKVRHMESVRLGN